MKSYTDIEQSKVLVGILPVESADMHYVRKTHDFMGNPVDGEWSHPKYGNPNSKYANYIVQNFTTYEKLPCWSLAALLGVLPEIDGISLTLEKVKAEDGYEGYYYYIEYKDKILIPYSDNPVDACYQMILKLKEENLL